MREDNEELLYKLERGSPAGLAGTPFDNFHRLNLQLHSELKTRFIGKLEQQLELCLKQLHSIFLRNNFLEQRVLQMEAEVENMVQTHRDNILRLSESFATHTLLTSAQQRFQQLRTSAYPKMPGAGMGGVGGIPGMESSSSYLQSQASLQNFLQTADSLNPLHH